MKTILRQLILMLALTALGACTSNNGNIGPWFGLWKVTEIKCDGVAVPNYDGNVFFMFQSTVFEMRQVNDNYEVGDQYGVWSDDGKGTLVITFPDEQYSPFEVTHMAQTNNVLTYSKVEDKGFDLTLHTESGRVYSYRLVKW
mgnify:CR=1 FL=1